MRFSHFYIVAAGLKPGDEIIYEGIQNVQDGLEIKPVFIPLDSIVAYTRSNSLSITN